MSTSPLVEPRGAAKTTHTEQERGKAATVIQSYFRTWIGIIGEFRFAASRAIESRLKAISDGRCNCFEDFRQFRELIAKIGVQRFHDSLTTGGYIEDMDGDGVMEHTENKIGSKNRRTGGLNIFASVARGQVNQSAMLDANESLGGEDSEFVMACNRPVNDEHWDDSEGNWPGTASMSRTHRFMVMRDTTWSWLNLLCCGMSMRADGKTAYDKATLEGHIAVLNRLKTAVTAICAADDSWEELGLFVHVFPYNSVMATHVHSLDMSYTGPSYEVQKYKNLPLDEAIAVFEAEVDELTAAAAAGRGCCGGGAASDPKFSYVHLPRNMTADTEVDIEVANPMGGS